MSSISDLQKKKYEELAQMKERQGKSLVNLKRSWDNKIVLERKRLAKEIQRKQIERKKARRRSTIAKIPYARVLYLQKLKEDREKMEAYKKEKNYTCEICGTKGLDKAEFEKLIVDVKNLEHLATLTILASAGDIPIKVKVEQDVLPIKVELFCRKSYIMCHHKEDGALQCLDRPCHDKEDQRLRVEGKSSKAIDKKAVMVEVAKLLRETAGHK